ncbi:MAG: DUF2934 domain-containing protein [Candidatus Omnitrophica bacterium]|nr:DUF2934 domain-containing protein [Candidatus Omnitrophota bacterium]MBU0878318.1 DUF2934 domain-containing protein [Candidatus Omnitrophota bacterium]MBU1134388.1 DUF2934 domain-containing protein [Candidatus Omnitrophota bacterium]MBU1367295.1 DUF2934 domain-containing protein [Candidatus Omnitrophota bacterium]MBU1523360.1 DUF2934 domain-containing protein [Candidatus Omnitrophota bacterium]
MALTKGKKVVVKRFKKTAVQGGRKLDEVKLNQMIKDRAYYIWEKKGKPQNQDSDIWYQAEKDIRAKV